MVTMETKCNSQPGYCNRISISSWTDSDYVLYGLPHNHPNTTKKYQIRTCFLMNPLFAPQAKEVLISSID